MSYESSVSSSPSGSANSSPQNGYLTPLTEPSSPPGRYSSMTSACMPSLPDIPDILTQDLVDADPALKRLQQDLLVLTSFRDNETLHWRPSWFPQGEFATKWWTLHNPPDVVTEILPAPEFGHKVYMRRMRRAEDPDALYIKTWEQWRTYCAFYGVPEDFLDRKMVELLRLGLPRDKNGKLCAPPARPMYPEPSPQGKNIYILNPSMHKSLPRKFHKIDEGYAIAVHRCGALEVDRLDHLYCDQSLWMYANGRGEYSERWSQFDRGGKFVEPQFEGKGRRWSWLPWTREQELSCRPWKLKFSLRAAARGSGP